MNGGYIMIYKSSKKIYLELFACLTLGKPILWYEDKNTCFFIDTISGGEITTEIVDDEEVRTYGDIILTKGGMTITITAENVVTEEGDIQPSEGSSVVANPTLSGDEDTLTSLEVDDVKYDIPSGGKTLYQHSLTLRKSNSIIALVIINDNNTVFTESSLKQYLYDNGYQSVNNVLMCSGMVASDAIASGVYSNVTTLYVSGVKTDLSGATDNIFNSFIISDTIIEL